jgi:hypothetical protein
MCRVRKSAIRARRAAVALPDHCLSRPAFGQSVFLQMWSPWVAGYRRYREAIRETWIWEAQEWSARRLKMVHIISVVLEAARTYTESRGRSLGQRLWSLLITT